MKIKSHAIGGRYANAISIFNKSTCIFSFNRLASELTDVIDGAALITL